MRYSQLILDLPLTSVLSVNYMTPDVPLCGAGTGRHGGIRGLIQRTGRKHAPNARSGEGEDHHERNPAANIVLVHAGFVDGSGWRAVYDLLTQDGYHVAS